MNLFSEMIRLGLQRKVDEAVKQVNFEELVAKAEEAKDKFKTIIKYEWF